MFNLGIVHWHDCYLYIIYRYSYYELHSMRVKELVSQLLHGNGNEHFLCKALQDIKNTQDILTNTHSPYFGNLLADIVGTDTIPIFLLTKTGKNLSVYNSSLGCNAIYFRIECVEKNKNRVTVSLLRSFDIYGEDCEMINEVVKLEKTNTKHTIDLSVITAIQLCDTALLKNNVFIESKW